MLVLINFIIWNLATLGSSFKSYFQPRTDNQISKLVFMFFNFSQVYSGVFRRKSIYQISNVSCRSYQTWRCGKCIKWTNKTVNSLVNESLLRVTECHTFIAPRAVRSVSSWGINLRKFDPTPLQNHLLWQREGSRILQGLCPEEPSH